MDAINFESWLPRGWTVERSAMFPDKANINPNTGRGGYYILERNPGAASWDAATYAIRYYPDRGDYPPVTLTKDTPIEEAFALIRAGDAVLRADRGQRAE